MQPTTKILKPGSPPPKQEYQSPQKTCDECGCVFEYTELDIKKTKGWGNIDEIHFVKCPQQGCTNKVTVYMT